MNRNPPLCTFTDAAGKSCASRRALGRLYCAEHLPSTADPTSLPEGFVPWCSCDEVGGKHRVKDAGPACRSYAIYFDPSVVVPPGDVAILLMAIAEARGDPLARFVRSLPDEPPHFVRRYAEETIRLREELVSNVQRLLLEEPDRVALHAEWLRKNAHEVAYRWATLRKAATRYAMLDTDAMIFSVRPKEPTP